MIQQSADEIKREIEGNVMLKKLKTLIFDLIEIEADVARIDVSERMASVRRVKRAMLIHINNSKQFKREVDAIRKKIISKKSLSK